MRILFAPTEICGQQQLLAKGFRQRDHVATSARFHLPPPGGHINDINLGFQQQSKLGRVLKQGLFAVWAAQNYDIFHFFFGDSLLPWRLDLPFLKRMGKKVFVHFRGSDIRNSLFFQFQEERFLGKQTTPPRLQTPQQHRSLKRWRRYADDIFVSTPDLLRIVPEAKLVQQAVDLSRWDYYLEPLDVNPQEIRVAHAPHGREKKGTEFVIKAIDDLRAQGYPVKLVLIEDVPNNEVKQWYQACQIGVGGLLIGWYGNVSIELMALGKPVVSYIDPELAKYRADLPIVSATPEDLADKLKPLIQDQLLRRRLGQQGRAYVEKWHDVNHIVDRLFELYQSES
ncbi:glycosyltransferase family 4 protein [Chloroflexota bacterium]